MAIGQSPWVWWARFDGGPVFEVALVVPDHFRDDEVQELAGELRVEVGLLGQPFEAGDLHRLRVRGRRGAGRAAP